MVLNQATAVIAQTVTYVQNANGQFLDTSSDGDTHNEPTDNDWSQATTNGTDRNNNMFVASVSNWSTPNYPNSASVDVDINLPVTLDVNVTVGTLTLGTSGTVITKSGNTLTLAGGVMMNDGTFTVHDNPSGSSLTFSTNAAISGGGSIVLDESDGNAYIATTGSAVVTQAAGHTIKGNGHISASLINNGIVDSNAPDGSTLSTINLGAFAMTNNGIMRAEAGDSLSLEQTTLTQGANGQLLANGGQINFDSASVTGGQLNAATGGTFRGGGVTLTAATNNATLSVNGYIISDTLTNNGVVNVLGNPYSGTLTFADDTTLLGTGSVTMTQGGYSFIATAPGATATQAAGHTINGTGNIAATIVNNGAIKSDNGGITFQNGSTLTNNALVTTTSNGGIQTNGVPITQGPNGQLVADGNTFRLTGGNAQSTTITGGTLASANGGMFITDSTLLTNVTNDATIRVGNLNIGGGSFANNGTIEVSGNPSQGNLEFGTDTTLTGTGSVVGIAGGYSRVTVDSGATLTVAAGQVIENNIAGNVVFDGGTLRSDGAIHSYDELISGTFTNAGVFEALDGGNITLDGAATLTNYNASTGALTGGTFMVVDAGNDATLNLNGESITTNAATLSLSGANANFSALSSLADNQGSLSLLALRQFTTAGDLFNEGTITLDAGSTLHVAGNFTASDAAASTGATGHVSGKHTQAATASTLSFVVGGTAAQGALSPGVLQVAGAAKMAGLIEIALSQLAATPNVTDSVVLVSAQSVTGTFDNAPDGTRLATTDGRGSYVVNYGATAIGLSRFLAPGQTETTPVVTVAVVGDGDAVEGGENGKVAIRRAGDITSALTVRYKVTGGVVAGVDYKALPGVAVIPAGASQVKIKIKPIDDSVVEGTRIAKVKLKPATDGSYALGSVVAAKVHILDND